MALTGQLSDMSLAELIEFFCNQRKTGRLKVDYHRGHGVFFIKDGELVDAKVGALSGADAVYFALTLPNAAFDFSPEFQPSRRTIEDKWTQVVLEGLRRLDEGTSPTETDAFGGWSPSEADMAVFMDQVERLGEGTSKKSQEREEESAPLSLMVEGASSSGGKKKWMVAASVACVVLAVAVAAIPLSGRFSGKSSGTAATATSSAAQPSATEPASAPAQAVATEGSEQASTEAATGEEASGAPVDEAAAQRWREEREREQRLREQRERERRQEEQARKAEAEQSSQTAATAPATPAAPSGPKSVRVQITYDEAGRVTAASVAGSSPGAEAYAGTAVRVARGKRFPAGKAGTTIVTIPVN